LVGDGADLLVNLSNESWLGSGTHGPDQMLAASVLRAIEERRPVLRSTTVGITAAIDAHGRIPARLPRSGEGVLVVDVVPEHAGSGFARWGHAPVGLIVVAWLVFRSIRILARHRSRQRA
ncbi:MAG TPA: apolipoprotein N-acyltransferase, partial [Deltaproteobacteria bacterium]|nr:apolipoprotein N-acyltransferase [Deltaproteobacteria bacterium]